MIQTLRCVMCGRRLKSAAATPVGPTCAGNAGLLRLSCRQVVASRRASRRALQLVSGQADWVSGVPA